MFNAPDRILNFLDRMLGAILASLAWLVIPIALLLFMQWQLRDVIQSYSREANDLGQWIYALLMASAVTAATRARTHISADALARSYPDAAWVVVLTLLALQTSFLLPPFGHALLLARNTIGSTVSTRALLRALLPFLVAQALVFALVALQPRFIHLPDPPGNSARGRENLTDDEARRRLQNLVPLPEIETLDLR